MAEYNIVQRFASRAGCFLRHRMAVWTWVAVALGVLLAVLYPAQTGVYLQKLFFVSAAASLGYWIDRVAFPYARPWTADGGDMPDDLMGPSMLRRAIVMAATMLAVALGV